MVDGKNLLRVSTSPPPSSSLRISLCYVASQFSGRGPARSPFQRPLADNYFEHHAPHLQATTTTMRQSPDKSDAGTVLVCHHANCSSTNHISHVVCVCICLKRNKDSITTLFICSLDPVAHPSTATTCSTQHDMPSGCLACSMLLLQKASQAFIHYPICLHADLQLTSHYQPLLSL